MSKTLQKLNAVIFLQFKTCLGPQFLLQIIMMHATKLVKVLRNLSVFNTQAYGTFLIYH